MSKANHNQNQFQKYGIDHLKFQSNFSCFKHFKKHRARTIFYGNSNDLTTIIHANNTPKTCHIFFANEWSNEIVVSYTNHKSYQHIRF